MFLASLMRHLSHLLLPQYCIFCRLHTQQAYPICIPCQEELPILPQHCRKCGQNLTLPDEIRIFCGNCLQHPPPYHRIYTLFPYEPPITKQIITLKFQHDLVKARAFGLLLAKNIQEEWYRHSPLPNLIIPVPLHPLRLKERGFNQALEIAKPIAKNLSIQLDRWGLKRIKFTSAQSSLPAKQRANNVRGAFVTSRNYKGLHIAVLDDVVTTGHTISEACQVLKLAGASRVDVWCCARRG